MFGRKKELTRQDDMGFTQVWDPTLERWIYPRDRFALLKGLSEYAAMWLLVLTFGLIAAIVANVADTVLVKGHDLFTYLVLSWPLVVAPVALAVVVAILLDWSKT
jgi:hypothetical protein